MAAVAAKKEDDGGGGRESPPPLTVDPTAPSGGQRSQGSSPAPGDATSTPKKASAEEGEGGNSVEESPPKYGSAGKIKASGIYYPLSAFPTSMPQGPVMSSPPTTVSNEGSANTSGRNESTFDGATMANVKSYSETKIDVEN